MFSVQVNALESPSGNPLADTLDHTVYLVNRSALALSGRVLEPPGAEGSDGEYGSEFCTELWDR